ncbi:MAG: hypothetical protein ABJC79_05470 [Acidimicrobiia bacterium]
MTTLTLTAWTDPIIDTLGHDPRSEYVERFWLPTLGPTSVLLLRRLATVFDRNPNGVTVEIGELSQSLGLGVRTGTSSPLARSLDRLTQFELACTTAPQAFAVRRNLPPINRRHIHRLPESLQREHNEWVEIQLADSPLEHARQRARRTAFALFEAGDDLDRVERVLLTMGFHPSICRESAEWAHERHRQAFAALEPEPDPTFGLDDAA